MDVPVDEGLLCDVDEGVPARAVEPNLDSGSRQPRVAPAPRVLFQCSMLQRQVVSGGESRWEAVKCTGDDDFESLLQHRASVDDFEAGDDVIILCAGEVFGGWLV